MKHATQNRFKQGRFHMAGSAVHEVTNLGAL